MSEENSNAGTPPAQNPPAGGDTQQQQQTPAANQQQQQQPGNNQQQSGEPEWFKRRWAEKLGDLEKEIGLPPGGLKDFIAAQKKAKQPPSGEVLSGADLKLAKMEALMLKGIPSKQIPLILQHFNIPGKTREDIETGIQQLIDAGLLKIEQPDTGQQSGGNQPQSQQGPPNAAQGAGNPGVPGSGSGPKKFSRREIQEKSKDPAWYEKNREAIMKAMADPKNLLTD